MGGGDGEIPLALEVLCDTLTASLLRTFAVSRAQPVCAAQGPQVNIRTFASRCVLGLFLCQASPPIRDPQTYSRETTTPTDVSSIDTH